MCLAAVRGGQREKQPGHAGIRGHRGQSANADRSGASGACGDWREALTATTPILMSLRWCHEQALHPEMPGFTLIEMVVTVAIVGLLASVALPLAEVGVKRSKEHELRLALREIRTGWTPTGRLSKRAGWHTPCRNPLSRVAAGSGGRGARCEQPDGKSEFIFCGAFHATPSTQTDPAGMRKPGASAAMPAVMTRRRRARTCSTCIRWRPVLV